MFLCGTFVQRVRKGSTIGITKKEITTKQELLEGLSQEQLAKNKQCRDSEEILRLAKDEGVELTDEQLEAVSGGSVCAPRCPVCNTKENVYRGKTDETLEKWVCTKCGTICGNFGP